MQLLALDPEVEELFGFKFDEGDSNNKFGKHVAVVVETIEKVILNLDCMNVMESVL